MSAENYFKSVAPLQKELLNESESDRLANNNDIPILESSDNYIVLPMMTRHKYTVGGNISAEEYLKSIGPLPPMFNM